MSRAKNVYTLIHQTDLFCAEKNYFFSDNDTWNQFGLEAISALRYINKEYDLKLRIRVGINTGGPIMAGVIGTDKPTFEILGPAINMAQQMKHHGVPMKVHISRSVYQLIYGGPFNIKERG